MTNNLGAIAENDASASWEPSQFYWSVVEAPGVWGAKSGEVSPGVLAAVEEDLPEPIDDLHAVCTPIDGGRLLICVARKADLRQLDPTIERLVPREVPEALGVRADQTRLNLLVGAFVPARIRQFRQRFVNAIVLLLLVCTVAGSVGLRRRTMNAEARAASSARLINQLLSEHAPGTQAEAITRTRDTLREAVAIVDQLPPRFAAPAVLADMLEVWPVQTGAKPQSMLVTQEGIAISVVADKDPAQFLEAMRAPIGYAAEEPKLAIVGDRTRLSLRFVPDPSKLAHRQTDLSVGGANKEGRP